MSTRGFVGFVIDGVEKIGYNHSDSYPEGLGNDVLTWLWTKRHALTCELHSTEMGGPQDLARKLRAVNWKTPPTAEDVERVRQAGHTTLTPADVDHDDGWYTLLRDTQGSPQAILESGYVEDASDFPMDSLFCEWGYLVDFDAKTFEVYRGFQNRHHDKGRFAGREVPERRKSLGHAPVALVASWRFDELPGEPEFLAMVKGG